MTRTLMACIAILAAGALGVWLAHFLDENNGHDNGFKEVNRR